MTWTKILAVAICLGTTGSLAVISFGIGDYPSGARLVAGISAACALFIGVGVAR